MNDKIKQTAFEFDKLTRTIKDAEKILETAKTKLEDVQADLFELLKQVIKPGEILIIEKRAYWIVNNELINAPIIELPLETRL